MYIWISWYFGLDFFKFSGSLCEQSWNLSCFVHFLLLLHLLILSKGNLKLTHYFCASFCFSCTFITFHLMLYFLFCRKFLPFALLWGRGRVLFSTHWARNFKKILTKKINQILFSWNYISGIFKLFPSSNMDFWLLLKLQKMDFGQKQFREIDLFDFTSFLSGLS